MPATAGNVRAARRFLSRLLEAVGADDLGDTAALCTTELMTNVLQHTQTEDLRVVVEVGADEVRIEVYDDSTETPTAVLVNPAAENGRGMLIIESLVKEWGIAAHPGEGKSIWIRLTSP